MGHLVLGPPPDRSPMESSAEPGAVFVTAIRTISVIGGSFIRLSDQFILNTVGVECFHLHWDDLRLPTLHYILSIISHSDTKITERWSYSLSPQLSMYRNNISIQWPLYHWRAGVRSMVTITPLVAHSRRSPVSIILANICDLKIQYCNVKSVHSNYEHHLFQMSMLNSFCRVTSFSTILIHIDDKHWKWNPNLNPLIRKNET